MPIVGNKGLGVAINVGAPSIGTPWWDMPLSWQITYGVNNVLQKAWDVLSPVSRSVEDIVSSTITYPVAPQALDQMQGNWTPSQALTQTQIAAQKKREGVISDLQNPSLDLTGLYIAGGLALVAVLLVKKKVGR